ncbi:ScbR family autoregulator-binding transcription factor [Streptomyces macrosporus]|uniref:ScbR family autoregulator-binding transcription factor n=1 Tax=Streptomyces macrosporus TaxID=44032 RepID=A0ABN3JG14_9ACTN
MAQQERGIRTRREVLEAAAEVFAERGYAAATISEILSRAGVTKGALYFHFASKEELLRGVLEEQFTEDDILPRSSKLQEWVDVGMALAHRLPREPLLRAGARLMTDPNLQEMFGKGPQVSWVELTHRLLVEAGERGELLPHVVPEETARFVVNAWNGVQLGSQIATRWKDLEQQVSVLFRHVLPAVAVPGMLPQIDTAPDRGERVVAEVRGLPVGV